MKLPSFDDQWPVRVELSEDVPSHTEAFAWLYGQIFKQHQDFKEVFTTMGNRTVAFKEEHKRLAAMFKLKYG